MFKKKDVKITIIACVIAIVVAVVSASFIPVIKANAATVTKTSVRSIPKKTTKKYEFAKAYCVKITAKITKSADWSYKADAKNIKAKCSYDKASGKHIFKFTGTSYGLSNVTLKYKVSNKKTESVKMKLFVDPKNYIMRTA